MVQKQGTKGWDRELNATKLESEGRNVSGGGWLSREGPSEEGQADMEVGLFGAR